MDMSANPRRDAESRRAKVRRRRRCGRASRRAMIAKMRLTRLGEVSAMRILAAVAVVLAALIGRTDAAAAEAGRDAHRRLVQACRGRRIAQD